MKKVVPLFGLAFTSLAVLSGCGEPNIYKVTFINEGSVLSTVDVEEGKPVSTPSETAEKAQDEYYTYSFDKWVTSSGEAYDFNSPVTGDLTLTASYTSTKRQYSVAFYNGDQHFDTVSVEAGEVVTAPAENPTKTAEGYTYTFDAWVDDGGDEFDFETEILHDYTLYASFTEQLVTYTATVHYSYDVSKQDETVTYNITNKGAKIGELKAKLPAEDEMYVYKFESLPQALPLQNATYNVVKELKGFDYDFEGIEELPEKLTYLNRSGNGSCSVADGKLTAVLDNSNLVTTESYKYFDMEFDVKFNRTGETGSDRFVMTFGATDEDANKTIAAPAQFNNRNGVMLVSGNFARYHLADVSGTQDVSGIANFSSEMKHVKVSMTNQGLIVEVDGSKVLNKVATTASLGKIIFSRADFLGTIQLDNFKITPTDGVIIIPKTFDSHFEGNVLPESLVHNGRSGETYTVTNGVYTSSLSNGNFHTYSEYSEFEAEFSIKTGNGRFAVELGTTVTNAGYANAKSAVGAHVGFYFLLNGSNTVYFLDNDAAREGKDAGNPIAKAVSTAGINAQTGFVDIKISYADGKINVWVGTEQVFTNQAPTTALGNTKLILAAISAPQEFNINHFKMTDLAD